jgi:hypothetical protein
MGRWLTDPPHLSRNTTTTPFRREALTRKIPGKSSSEPPPFRGYDNPLFKPRLFLVGSFPWNWRDPHQPEEVRLV